LVGFILLLLNLKFLAFTFILVYVGAVALLFIFIVFMVGPVEKNKVHVSKVSNGFFFLGVAKFQVLLSIALSDFCCQGSFRSTKQNPLIREIVVTEDINLISSILYTEHFFLFFLTSVVLLLALVGTLLLASNQIKVLD
jgi:NADH-quinone oxidoreductase subunit J